MFGNSLMLANRNAVDSEDYIVGTANGEIWQTRNGIDCFYVSKVSNNIIFGLLKRSNIWVAVGASGSVFTSEDNGDSWVQRDSKFGNSQNQINSIDYSPILDLYVICGDAGKLATSPDAKEWTLRSTGNNGFIYDVRWHDASNEFFGVQNTSQSVIRSPNGTTWTRQSVSGLPAGNPGVSIASNGSRLWIPHSSTGAFSENNGSLFTSQNTSFLPSQAILRGFILNDGTRLSVGQLSRITRNGTIVRANGASGSQLWGIAQASNGTLFAVGNTNSSYNVPLLSYSLNNGQTWIDSNQNLPSNTSLFSISRNRP